MAQVTTYVTCPACGTGNALGGRFSDELLSNTCGGCGRTLSKPNHDFRGNADTQTLSPELQLTGVTASAHPTILSQAPAFPPRDETRHSNDTIEQQPFTESGGNVTDVAVQGEATITPQEN